MANENKITQIIINQEPYTIGNESDNTQYLPLSGGTMTGPINLAGDPTAELQAATKKYVDEHTPTGDYLPIGGGKMNGDIDMNNKVIRHCKMFGLKPLANLTIPAILGNVYIEHYRTDDISRSVVALFYNKGASGLTENVRLLGIAEPESNSEAANKKYVDNLVQSSSSVPIVHTVENLLNSPSYQGEFEFTVPKDCMFWVQVLVTITTRPSLPGTGGSEETENDLDYLTISIVSGTKYHYEYKWSGKFAGVLEFYPNYSNNTFGETEDVTFTISTDSPNTGVGSIGEVKLSYIKFPTYTKDE